MLHLKSSFIELIFSIWSKMAGAHMWNKPLSCLELCKFALSNWMIHLNVAHVLCKSLNVFALITDLFEKKKKLKLKYWTLKSNQWCAEVFWLVFPKITTSLYFSRLNLTQKFSFPQVLNNPNFLNYYIMLLKYL